MRSSNDRLAAGMRCLLLASSIALMCRASCAHRLFSCVKSSSARSNRTTKRRLLQAQQTIAPCTSVTGPKTARWPWRSVTANALQVHHLQLVGACRRRRAWPVSPPAAAVVHATGCSLTKKMHTSRIEAPHIQLVLPDPDLANKGDPYRPAYLAIACPSSCHAFGR